MEPFTLTTGTATICIFDRQALKHRIPDYVDWWSDEDQELKEVNAGNALFVALGADGRYTVEIRDGRPFEGAEREVTALLDCPTGQVFIGPGEDVTGGGGEPSSGKTDGRMVEMSAGTYEVQVCRIGPWNVGVSFSRTNQVARNTLDKGLALVE